MMGKINTKEIFSDMLHHWWVTEGFNKNETELFIEVFTEAMADQAVGINVTITHDDNDYEK